MARMQTGGLTWEVAQRGKGVPLLLVHGFPLDHTMWQKQLDDLSQVCRVVAPDLRGFGRSEVTPGMVSMGQFADDLAALLDALQISEPMIFCGLSMGGYVAWQFWRRHRSRLRGLILCDTRSVADSPEAAAGRRTTADKVVAQGPQVIVESMLPKLFAEQTTRDRPDLVEATRQVMLGNPREGIAAALRGMADRPDMTAELPQVSLPVLCLCGQHDVISPPAEMRSWSARIPRAEFVEIAEAGHMAPLEQPAAVNAAIRNFLGKLA